MNETASPLVEALQAALGQEHAAVYGYALVGAHLDGAAREAASDHLDAHRRARDALEAQLRANDATPAQAAASYSLPFQVTDTKTARSLAAQLERSTLGAYVRLVGRANGPVRRQAITAMQEAATRQAAWSRTIDPLPGLQT